MTEKCFRSNRFDDFQPLKQAAATNDDDFDIFADEDEEKRKERERRLAIHTKKAAQSNKINLSRSPLTFSI